MNITELGSLDFFFYYGQIGTDEETEHDIMLGLLQPKKSLFYNRQDGAGIQAYENHPNSLLLEVGLRFDIVNWIARRNSEVGDGDEDTVDRRVLVSQNFIKINRDETIEIQVLYIPFRDTSQPRTMNIPLGGNI
jgi:hypothetical protein